jgi:hypothetical protein
VLHSFSHASRMSKRLRAILAVAAIVALIFLWVGSSPKEAAFTSATSEGERNDSSISAQSSALTPDADPSAAPATSARSDQETGRSNTYPASAATPVKVDIRAPNTVHAGDLFQLMVDVEALRGLNQITLTVKFDQRLLQLVGSSAGPFVEQAGSAAKFDAGESCDGNTVQLNIAIANGQSIAGAGGVAALEFRAREAGVSPVSVQDVVFVESAGANPVTTDSSRDMTIRVEPAA